MSFNTIEEAVEDLRLGKMIVVLDDEDRENEGDLIMSAELVTPEDVNFMAREGRGLICAPLDGSIADRLGLHAMVENNTESSKCNFTVSTDYTRGTSTGISASDRALTLRSLASLDSVAGDFARPGHVFPLRARDGGTLVRAGHTEAAIDLMKLAGLVPAGVICEITREDGEMMRGDELHDFAEKHGFKIITVRDLIEFRRRSEKLVALVAETKLPTDFGEFQMKVYESEIDGVEHVALVRGDIGDGKGVLVRVQSECLTGEVFLSQKCDCRAQLDGSLKLIAEEGRGVLLYMRQHEGRGIGLTNKVKAYKLQDEGYDTVDANVKLGFPMDLRDYGIGAQILVDLGLKDIKLLTNNPRKLVGLEGYGLCLIERVPIQVQSHEKSHGYLRTKKERMGHLLDDI